MASVKFRLNRRTTDNSPTSIIVRFYSKQTGPLDFSTGEMVPPVFWEGQRVSSKYRKNHDRINKHLSKIECDMLDVWRDNKAADGEQLKTLVRECVKGNSQTVEKKTVVEALTKFIAQYAREKEIGTVKRYRGLLKKLTAFNPELTFEQLDHNFYDAFKTFLYSCRNPVYTKYRIDRNDLDGTYIMVATNERGNVGLFDDTVYKYLVNIKTLCAWAEKRDYQVHKSYKEWEIIKRDYSPISLTYDELQKIETINLPEKHLDIARDYLALECRTGQRISDLRRFSRDCISGNVWTFAQKKGSRLNSKTISLPLVGFCAPALLILQKYNYELPKISEQKLNKHIKTVCERAGLTYPIYIERWAGNKKIRIPGAKSEFISSHTGRKTFITLALQKGMPVKIVMDLTGIRSYKTLRHYDGQSEIGTVEKWLTQIEDKPVMRKAN